MDTGALLEEVEGMATTNRDYIELDERHAAHNYHPLPVVAASAEGAWVTDVEGRRYLDMLSAYSALNFGHRHPRLVAAAVEQLGRVTLTSRAYHNDQLGHLCRDLADLTGLEAALVMNTGAEAVETGLKLARKWGYEVKGVAPGRAKVIVCDGNFHGRTISIVSFSSDPTARTGFGPFTPGFVTVPFGDAAALEAAIDDDTVAFLVEPIQGEAGVIIPPDGYLAAVRDVCRRHGVLLIADEIQSGLARTGATLACEHEGVTPDVALLGKALGGGIVPLSAVVTRWDVLEVIRPGEHGSTFGGNPLAAAVGREVAAMLRTGEFQERAAKLGLRLAHGLDAIVAASPHAVTHRSRGLWAGLDLAADGPTGRHVAEALLTHGVIAKDTHHTTIRLAPPLVIEDVDVDWGVAQLAATLGV